jgi:hypothetical protein
LITQHQCRVYNTPVVVPLDQIQCIRVNSRKDLFPIFTKLAPKPEFFVESLETPSLTKSMLIERLNENLGLNVREAKDMVDSVFELMSTALISGDDVKLSGFGNFQIRAKAP